ncbi:hypothetical protein IG631_22207 [Alternaria alternata]|nr:hypothetical protein IG631_22207 [Alternaria alternata]
MPEYGLVSNDILCNFTAREVELSAAVSNPFWLVVSNRILPHDCQELLTCSRRSPATRYLAREECSPKIVSDSPCLPLWWVAQRRRLVRKA